jgi:hypothetical protein
MLVDIACFGTSLTWMYQWQPTLVDILATNGVDARTYNLGASGRNSGWALSNIAPVLRLRPKIALVEFSMNDCAVMSASSALSNTAAIIDALKTVIAPGNIFLMTMNPTVGSSPLATTRASLPTFYQDYRGLAATAGVGYILQRRRTNE